MPTFVDARREAARAFFEFLERQLKADEVFTDKQCVRLIIEKAQAERAAQSRKRFDAEETFRRKVLYGRIDDAIAAWCRKREIRTDPYNVFRYEGPERGPTQHETAIGPSLSNVKRAFERLAQAVPELSDCSAAVSKAPSKAIAPAFRLQHPLPFGAPGEVKLAGTRKDLERGIWQVAMYAATGGDPSRSWRYDCGLFVFYGAEPPRALLGNGLFEIWPEVRTRVWESGRVWVILL
ncbi:MAG: hypothetical protein ACHQ9S_20840 [Candidatus Binatia bacterium]